MWLLPTFNRPEKCRDVLEQLSATGCSTPGVVWVNGGNRQDDYSALQSLLPAGWTMHFNGKNVGVCGALNEFFMRHPGEKWYGLFCDDEFIHSRGWDIELVGAAGDWCISNANDNWQASLRLHTYVVWGGELLRSVGWWACPGLWHWYFDAAWEWLAAEFGLRRWCPTVKSEHRHINLAKASVDEAWGAGMSRRQQDAERFACWAYYELPGLRERLAKVLPHYAAPHSAISTSSHADGRHR